MRIKSNYKCKTYEEKIRKGDKEKCFTISVNSRYHGSSRYPPPACGGDSSPISSSSTISFDTTFEHKCKTYGEKNYQKGRLKKNVSPSLWIGDTQDHRGFLHQPAAAIHPPLSRRRRFLHLPQISFVTNPNFSDLDRGICYIKFDGSHMNNSPSEPTSFNPI